MNCDVRYRLNGLAVQKHQGTWSRDFLANDLRMHEVLTCKQSTWQTQHNNDYESEIEWSVLTVPVSLRATLILLPHAHRSVSSFNHINLQKTALQPSIFISLWSRHLFVPLLGSKAKEGLTIEGCRAAPGSLSLLFGVELIHLVISAMWSWRTSQIWESSRTCK